MKKDNFLDYLLDLKPSPEELKDGAIRKQIGDFFNERAITESYNHGIYLHTAGSICNKIFFVEKGVLRGFRITQNKQKEHTVFLWGEKAMATDPDSFLFVWPSDIYIQVLADAAVTIITYDIVTDLLQRFPFMEPFRSRLKESQHQYNSERFTTNSLTAKERFDELRKSYPNIELTVAKGYLASYLGLSRRHFQRLTRD